MIQLRGVAGQSAELKVDFRDQDNCPWEAKMVITGLGSLETIQLEGLVNYGRVIGLPTVVASITVEETPKGRILALNIRPFIEGQDR